MTRQMVTWGWERPFNDVLGRDLRSKQGNGNKYVLTLSCRSSCWPFTIPVQNVRSKTITDKLSELFCSIGIPKTLVLDSMLSFRSELFAQWARDLDIKLNFSAPNHPISHAHMEKANSVISQMLKKFIHDYGSNWDKLLPYLLFAIRTGKKWGNGP